MRYRELNGLWMNILIHVPVFLYRRATDKTRSPERVGVGISVTTCNVQSSVGNHDVVAPSLLDG